MYTEDVDFCAALRARGRPHPVRAAAPRSCTCAADRRQSAAGGDDRAYRRSQLAFYGSTIPRWAPLLRAVSAAARPRSDTMPRGLPVRIAIDARKLHDFGIGTYIRNLLTELARLDDDDRVRRCSAAPTTSSGSRGARAATSGRSSSAPATTRCASRSRCRWRCGATGVDAVPRAALRRCRRSCRAARS